MINITEKAQINKVLGSLRERIPDIEGCTISSREGLVIESELLQEVENKVFAALSSELTKSGEIVTSELKIGNLTQIIISSSKGNIVTTNIGKKAILICLVQKKANLGLVLLHMDRTAHRLSKLIK